MKFEGSSLSFHFLIKIILLLFEKYLHGAVPHNWIPYVHMDFIMTYKLIIYSPCLVLNVDLSHSVCFPFIFRFLEFFCVRIIFRLV